MPSLAAPHVGRACLLATGVRDPTTEAAEGLGRYQTKSGYGSSHLLQKQVVLHRPPQLPSSSHRWRQSTKRPCCALKQSSTLLSVPICLKKCNIASSSLVSHLLHHTNAPCTKAARKRKGEIRAASSRDIPAALSEATTFLTSQPPSWAATLAVNGLVFSLGYPVLRSGLTNAGVASSFLLGVAAWKGFGPAGYVIVCLYFILGTAVTKLRIQQKEAEGIAEKRQGRRGPASVVGSAASAIACAAGASLALGGPLAAPLWQLGYVASFCTKLSDTTASEVGKAYGKTTYLITNLSLVPRGTEGAVSLEGTVAGLLAAVVLAGIAFLAGLVDAQGLLIAVVASQVANVFESWLGATSQGRAGLEWLSNDLVNVLNISVGTTVAILLRIMLSGQ